MISQKNTVYGGMIAGVLAGIAMAIVACLVAYAQGQGLLSPLYLISGIFWGVNALVGGHAVAFVGLITHLVISAGLGAIFSLLTEGQDSPSSSLVGGLAYGITVWAVMTYLIQPWANPMMSARVALTQGWWFIEHLAFGATLFTTPYICRALAHGEVNRHFEESWEERHRHAA